MRNSSWNDLVALIDGKDLIISRLDLSLTAHGYQDGMEFQILIFIHLMNTGLKSNLKAVNIFPDVWFLPSFWSEYGMCTEPSAFGSRMIFLEKNLPHAEKIISGIEDG